MAEKGEKSQKAPVKKGSLQLQIVVDYEKPFPSFYSNYAAVSHTPSELCIDFCVLAPPHRVNMDGKTTDVPVIARMLIPEGMARGLVSALQDQIQKFDTTKKTNIIAISKKA